MCEKRFVQAKNDSIKKNFMLWIKTSLRIQLVGKSLVNFSRKFLTVGENQKEPALFPNCQLIFILARTKER